VAAELAVMVERARMALLDQVFAISDSRVI
jgi:hypothetical protein